MEKLDRNTRAVTGTMDKYPQESYATVDRVIQPEWKILQRVKKTTGQAFEGLEKFLQETFLTCILFGRLNPPLPVVGAISTLTVKKSSMVLRKPVT